MNETFAKVKIIFPKNPKLLKYATQILVGDKLLVADFEIKCARNQQPELVLHIPPQGFEIEFEEDYPIAE